MSARAEKKRVSYEEELRRQRDQLLEAIEDLGSKVRYAFKGSCGPALTAFFELADQIKGTSKVASDGEDASKEPETCVEDSRLQELLEWVDVGAADWRRDSAATNAYMAVANRIRSQLQANEEKGGEG